jgi:molybdate transport system substrate-binding protein
LTTALAGLPFVVRAEAQVTVFAAASLSGVLRRIEVELGAPVRWSFAASSTLARQIEQGASVDIFISADVDWMDHLVKLGRIDVNSRRVVAGNRLAVVGRGKGADGERSESLETIRSALDVSHPASRIVTADPTHVPLGRYAERALRSLGLWDSVAPRLVRADNARSALAFVERGEAGAGIVYATDAFASKSVRITARFPAWSHPRIVYPAALTTLASKQARSVFAHLFGPVARDALQAAGFSAMT